jgi:hypothetical protein
MAHIIGLLHENLGTLEAHTPSHHHEGKAIRKITNSTSSMREEKVIYGNILSIPLITFVSPLSLLISTPSHHLGLQPRQICKMIFMPRGISTLFS